MADFEAIYFEEERSFHLRLVGAKEGEGRHEDIMKRGEVYI